MISSFRRNFLSGTAALAATAALAPLRAQVPAKPKTRLVLLGTGGGPRIVAPGRSKSANLIVANGVPYVVDCGEGVAQQLVRGRRSQHAALRLHHAPPLRPQPRL